MATQSRVQEQPLGGLPYLAGISAGQTDTHTHAAAALPIWLKDWGQQGSGLKP